mgnify:CR=1 FL=1
MAIYTAISDCYDTLKPQPQSFRGPARQLAFLDRPTAELHAGHFRGWSVEARDFPVAEPRRASRYFKANAHLALPEAEVSLWIDASIVIVAPITLARLADRFLRDADICVFAHHSRRSVAEEAAACKALGLDDSTIIDPQLERQAAEGMPPGLGLAELPVILRRHTPAIRVFNEAWWEQILRGSHRDQLSFDHVAWKTGIQYARFPMTLAVRNGLFMKFRRPAEAGALHAGEGGHVGGRG